MAIYTIQLAKWRYLAQEGIPLLDITVKSGDQRFAPVPADLWEYKAGRMSDDEYAYRYYNKLKMIFDSDPSAFSDIVSASQHSDVVLACYCPAGKFCHRHLMVRFLEWLAYDNDLDLCCAGELQGESYDPTHLDRYLHNDQVELC